MNALLGTSLDVVEDYYAAESEPIRICADVSRVETLAIFNDKYLLDNSLLKFIRGIRSGAKAGLVDVNLELLEVPYQLEATASQEENGGKNSAVKPTFPKAREIYYNPEPRGYLETDENATLTFPSVLREKYRPLFIEKVLEPLRRGGRYLLGRVLQYRSGRHLGL